MPSTYAHYRMGQQVRKKLAKEQKEIVEKYPELYLIGLHGPDILFYYRPLFSNPINRIGYATHERTGRKFFENAMQVIVKHPDPEPYLSYCYGVLNHFALDMSCHGYIDEKIAASGVSHTEIEVEFDRMLMLRDHHNPLTYRLTRHIRPSIRSARVIAPFYPGTSKRHIFIALLEMILYNRLLIAPSKGKREWIYRLLRWTGNEKEMRGLLVNYHPNPKCADSNEELFRRYQKAGARALRWIGECSRWQKEPKRMPRLFGYSFGAVWLEEGKE